MSRFELLAVQPDRIGLVDREHPEQSPIVVDFINPKMRHRVGRGVDGEAIVKAVGIKQSQRNGIKVFDFTAGLGTDAFLLACAGFSVVAYERDPAIYALLASGWKRWQKENGENAIDLRFIHADAMTCSEKASVIVLDPMFEDDALEGKSKPKKEMATLRAYLASQTENRTKTDTSAVAANLLLHAQATASTRVIVKRPIGSPSLPGPAPAGKREGKSARYDIYPCRS